MRIGELQVLTRSSVLRTLAHAALDHSLETAAGVASDHLSVSSSTDSGDLWGAGSRVLEALSADVTGDTAVVADLAAASVGWRSRDAENGFRRWGSRRRCRCESSNGSVLYGAHR